MSMLKDMTQNPNDVSKETNFIQAKQMCKQTPQKDALPEKSTDTHNHLSSSKNHGMPLGENMQQPLTPYNGGYYIDTQGSGWEITGRQIDERINTQMEERTPYYKDPVKQEEVTKKLFTRA